MKANVWAIGIFDILPCHKLRFISGAIVNQYDLQVGMFDAYDAIEAINDGFL